MTYVTKDFTRVEGPYIIGDFDKVLTRQLREFYERIPYDWQDSIRELATSYMVIFQVLQRSAKKSH